MKFNFIMGGGGPMKGINVGYGVSYNSNHLLHLGVNFKKRPIKNENTQTLTHILEWMFSNQ